MTAFQLMSCISTLIVLWYICYNIYTSRRWNIVLGKLSWPSRYGLCLPWQHLQKKLLPINSASIYIVYHIGTINNYQKVVAEQMATLQTSGLYDLCEAILVGANGPGCVEFTEQLRQQYSPKIKLLPPDAIIETPKTYERCTLNGMIEFAKHQPPSSLFCYIHSKGVTETTVAQPSWRRFMMYWVVTQHHIHRTLLGTPPRYVTSGVFFSPCPSRMYSGNFFWATGAYIRTWEPLTGKSISGRLADELLCLRKATPHRHIVLVPKESHRLFHFCSYHDEELIIPDDNPWVAEIKV